MADVIPSLSSLAAIYDPDRLPEEEARWARLRTAFRAMYGTAPDLMARSPGRVNIIGEHVDYSLYAVLPMAVSADAVLAVACSRPTRARGRDDGCDGGDDGGNDGGGDGGGGFTVRIANVDSARFSAVEFSVPDNDGPLVDPSRHHWTNYFKAGLAGALTILRDRPDFQPGDLCVLVDGSVPVAAGLSSSAALVTASALASLVAGGMTAVDRRQLTQLAIVSERSVGVNSGGMDQAASVLAERGAALLVSFSPELAAAPVAIPAGLYFLVAQSFVTADKQASGPVHFNLRVVECTLAAMVLHALARLPGPLPPDQSPFAVSLHGFHDAYFSARTPVRDPPSPAREARELHELVDVVRATLTQHDGYTRQDVAAILALSVSELEKRFMSRLPVRADRFQLRQRAEHVYAEALRVRQYAAMLAGAPAPGESGTLLGARLGALLNESHASCRELYDCSCPELDQLCNIARRAGALGSRLTGAGWGGCTVHLVAAPDLAAVTGAWEREYYGPRGTSAEDMQCAIVVSTPGPGSAIFRSPAHDRLGDNKA